MKRRIISLLVSLSLLAALALPLVSCGSSDEPEDGTVTRMTVDVNPSVEFIVDDENKVVSVTALNDDGSLLIAGEVFVGMSPEEAVEAVLDLAAETGYLVKGNASEEDNRVKISVSGDTSYAENLKNDLVAAAEEELKKLDIDGAVAKIDALNDEALKALALNTTLLTEEELKEMSDNEIYAAIAESRIETAGLLTEDMREAYYCAKEYRISFAESEKTAAIIEEMGGIYAVIHSAYSSALKSYSDAITQLDRFRYDMLIDPDCEYQLALAKLREKKAEFLKQRTYTASLEVNGEEYANATVKLAATEEDYDKALAHFESVGDSMNASLEAVIATLRQAETALVALEDSLFDDNIKQTLTDKAAEIEQTLNTAKDGFFAEFETQHAEDIKALEEELIARKEKLIADITG